MTPKPGIRGMFSPDSTEPSTPGAASKPTISFADVSKLWHSEVPKVLQAHEEQRRLVRESLGLA